MSSLIDGSSNVRAYEKIEAIDNFSSFEEIVAYRKGRIDRYASVAQFIAASSRNQSPKLSVVEVGSGSSALLYRLAQENKLRNAVAIELSKSRHIFAEQWKSDDGYDNVKNVNENFVRVDLEPDAFDWFVVIDNTFTYLYPEDSTYPDELLRRAFKALRPEGRILLDFINYAKREPEIEIRLWNAFPELDPFAYGLYSTRISNGINATESIFIRRGDGSESRKMEFSKVYSLNDLQLLLNKCGFLVSEVFSGFEEEPYKAEFSERLVVVATKASKTAELGC